MKNAPHNDDRAVKSLGQHFLHDRNISARIVSLLDVQAEDNIIEIGPGPGALTRLLLESPAAHLLLLEKDRRFAARWGQEHSSRLTVLLTDALTFAWERITKENPCKIVGNLPYNVASPLMWDIFSRSAGMRRGVFMVQKEVAERITAKPGSKAYGALSVWTSSFVNTAFNFVVGPKCFSPPPKVDSAVISVTPLRPDLLPENPKQLALCVKMCFQNRRKQLGTILRMNGLVDVEHKLENLGIEPRIRPECLSKEDFMRLAEAFKP